MNNYDAIAIKIDEAADAGDERGLDDMIREIDKLLADGADHALLHYYRANAFAGKRRAPEVHIENQFRWRDPMRIEELLALRRSIASSDFSKLENIRKCQVFTNLGMAFRFLGRPIAALKAWNEALTIEPAFAMAAANRAHGLESYSYALYDPGHQCLFLDEASKGYAVALSEAAVWDSMYPPNVRDSFSQCKLNIDQILQAQCADLANLDLNHFDIDEHEAIWRLKNGLFLNPLNDLGPLPVAASDVFHLPTHTYDIGEKPYFVKMYDLLKQEYLCACTLLFEGLQDSDKSYSERNCLMFVHDDSTHPTISTEKQKISFRVSYSILDKCAVFIAKYFEIRSDFTKVSFRNIWFEGSKKNRTLHTKLPESNFRLRGLYYTSLDLFDDEMREVCSPHASRANALRNATEHRFVSIHEFMSSEDHASDLFERVSKEDLYYLSLNMLHLAREVLMGISLAVNHHEMHDREVPEGKFVVSIPSLARRHD